MQASQKEKRSAPPPDLQIIGMKKLSTAQRNDLCATCHAKLLALTADFKPGDRFFDHYSIAGLESEDFFPDGRDYRENYTLTSWMMSACAKAGKLDCLHCHTSSGSYRFEDNRACLPCHEDRVTNAVGAHASQSGRRGRPVRVVPYAHHRIRAHAPHRSWMRPPTPATTIAYKSPNACNASATRIGTRLGRQTGARPAQAGLPGGGARGRKVDRAARRRDWNDCRLCWTTCGRPDHDEIFAASLIRLLWNSRTTRGHPVLIQSPERSVAAGPCRGGGRPGGARQSGALPRASQPRRTTTTGWSASAPERRSPGRAITRGGQLGGIRGIAATRPDDYSQHMNLGVLYADRGRLQEAVAEYDTAIRLRPDFAPPLVNASVAYSQLGEDGKAEAALRRALQIDPRNSAANLNLGLLLAEKQRLPRRKRRCGKPVEADPANAVAAYNLSVILSRDRLAGSHRVRPPRRQLRPDIPNYAEAAQILREDGPGGPARNSAVT